MKSELALCLVIAAGLHAGVILLGPSVQTAARLDGAVEVGLEEGDAGSTAEPAPQPSPEPPPPEPAAPPASPTPTPTPQEEVPKPVPEPVREMEKPAETPPAPAAPAIATEADRTPATPVANASPAPSPPTSSVAPSKPTPAAKSPAASARGRPGGGGPAGLVSSVRYRQRASLSYPTSALRDHAGGSVLLEILIDEEGRAAGVTVRRSSGRADLDAAAMACARQSTYEPYRVDGTPRPCRVEAPFHFEPRAGR